MMNEQRQTLFTIEFKPDGQGNLVMDKFHAYNSFMNLPMNIQHELINGVMIELGESPAYVGREKISLNQLVLGEAQSLKLTDMSSRSI